MINNFKEPYYLVDFNASICNFEVLVNDMPAFLNNKGMSISSHVPVNHLICSSGKQSIQIRVLPLAGETTLRKDSFLKIKVQFFDATGSPEIMSLVLHWETPDLTEKLLPTIVHEEVFTADVPYRQAGWHQSEPLENNDTQVEAAVNFYKKVYTLLRDGKNDEFLQLLSIRLHDIDEATYINGADNVKEWYELIGKLKGDGYILSDFPEETRSFLYGNKKVLNITRMNGTPILNFVNKEEDTFNFPFLIHKLLNHNGYTIIR